MNVTSITNDAAQMIRIAFGQGEKKFLSPLEAGLKVVKESSQRTQQAIARVSKSTNKINRFC